MRLFCHPGYMDGLYCGGYTNEREMEVMALTSGEVRNAVAASNVNIMWVFYDLSKGVTRFNKTDNLAKCKG